MRWALGWWRVGAGWTRARFGLFQLTLSVLGFMQHANGCAPGLVSLIPRPSWDQLQQFSGRAFHTPVCGFVKLVSQELRHQQQLFREIEFLWLWVCVCVCVHAQPVANLLINLSDGFNSDKRFLMVTEMHAHTHLMSDAAGLCEDARLPFQRDECRTLILIYFSPRLNCQTFVVFL